MFEGRPLRLGAPRSRRRPGPDDDGNGERAGDQVAEIRLRSGFPGNGNDEESHLVLDTDDVAGVGDHGGGGDTSAKSPLTVFSAFSPSERMTRAATPVGDDAQLMLGAGHHVEGFGQGVRPLGRYPGEVTELTADDVDRTPVRKPVIADYDTKRVSRPIRTTPAATMTAPAIRVSRNNASGRSAPVESSHRGAGGERRRRRL